MAYYVILWINGTLYDDYLTADVKSLTGDDNTASNFKATFDNKCGKYSTTFTVGDEVEIYIEPLGEGWPWPFDSGEWGIE